MLPWAQFWASTWPFGTPFGPYLLDWGLTAIVILAVPAGDAFNFGWLPEINDDYVELTPSQ